MIPKTRVYQIKNAVSFETILAKVDVKPTREGFSRCPLCKSNGSTCLTFGDKYFQCSECGASGDKVELVKKLFNVGFRDAVECLANMAGMSLENDTTLAYSVPER